MKTTNNHLILIIYVTFLATLFCTKVNAQNSYSLYFNKNNTYEFTHNQSLVNSNQVYFIECDDSLVYIRNHYIEINSYPDHCLFYFDNEFIGNFNTKRWINNRHMILYFIESKTYYYFYRSLNS
jgi:hypothetical protein